MRCFPAQSPSANHAGSSAEFVIVAKDVKGVRKSLGGDVFKASWLRVGGSEPAVSARVRPITQRLSPKPYSLGQLSGLVSAAWAAVVRCCQTTEQRLANDVCQECLSKSLK